MAGVQAAEPQAEHAGDGNTEFHTRDDTGNGLFLALGLRNGNGGEASPALQS